MKNLILLLCLALFSMHSFADMPLSRHGKGLKRDHAKFKAFLKAAIHRKIKSSVKTAQLAASGDLSGVASLPRDQGQCGDCWAYALTKALQSELMINGNGGPSSLLDVEYLTANCGGPVQEYGCNGGDFPAGQNFLNGLGPWANGTDPADGYNCSNLAPMGTAASFVMLGDGNNPPSDLDMVQAMSEGHVLVEDLAADNSWSNYPYGAAQVNGLPVWKQTTSTSIDHMINRLGWKCASITADGKYCVFDANGNSAGIVYLDMNNWGENWGTKAPNGHGGYIYETRLANLAGQDVAYFTVAPKPVPVPPPLPPVPPAPPAPSCQYTGWFMCFLGCWVPFCH